MRSVLLMLSSVCFAVSSCGPQRPTGPYREPIVYPIRAEELYRFYRDGRPSPTWDGATVRLQVAGGEYEASDRTIRLVKCGGGWCIHCESDSIPFDNTRGLTITGVCRGPVHDGIRRTAATTHHVRIERCSILVD